MSEAVFTDSLLTYPEPFAIFEKPVQSYGIKRSDKVTFYPTNDYTTQNLLQFSIPNNGNSYIDLKQTRLNVSCKVLFKDGTPFEQTYEDDEIKVIGTETPDIKKQVILSTVNSFLTSMFSRVSVSLQNGSFSSTDDSYPFTSYIKSLLYTPKEIQETTLATQMFFRDTPGTTGHINALSSTNQGLKTRAKYFDESNEVHMSGKIYNDLFDSKKFLLNSVPIDIVLQPSNCEFSLLNADQPKKSLKIQLSAASLDVVFVQPSPEVIISHSEVLKSKPAIFPYMRTDVKKFTLAKGLHSGEISNPFPSQLPSELIIGFVRNKAVYGDLAENPFYFGNFSLNSLRLSIDGQDMGGFKMKFESRPEKSSYLQGYQSLFGIGENASDCCPLTPKEYHDGSTFYRYSWEGSPETDKEGVLPLRRFGNLHISFNFDEALDAPLTIILFARFPAALKIDNSRAVYEI